MAFVIDDLYQLRESAELRTSITGGGGETYSKSHLSYSSFLLPLPPTDSSRLMLAHLCILVPSGNTSHSASKILSSHLLSLQTLLTKVSLHSS